MSLIVAFARRVLHRSCGAVSPGYHLDGLTVRLERKYSQRCLRPAGHAGAHRGSANTWKDPR